MTIEQLQAYVDSKPDIRGLINVIVDYMQANPGGGGGSETFDEVLDNGSTLTQNRTILLNGKNFNLNNGDQSFLLLDPLQIISRISAYDPETGTGTELSAQADVSGGHVGFDLYADNGTNQVIIHGDAIENTLLYQAAEHTFEGDASFDSNVIITNAASGTFTTNDGKTVTVVSGIITSIVNSP